MRVFQESLTKSFIRTRNARTTRFLRSGAGIKANYGDFVGRMKSSSNPLELSAGLGQIGLHLEENLDPAAIEARYFQGRSDRCHAIEHFQYARAIAI